MKKSKLNEIAQTNTTWKKKAEKRRADREWQKLAQTIAVNVLAALRQKKMKQKDLAGILGVTPQQVSKIVSGQENLTLQTIAKLERALEIRLINTDNVSQPAGRFLSDIKKAKSFRKHGNLSIR